MMINTQTGEHQEQQGEIARKWTATERIVLADDDSDILKSIASVLELFGYTVEPVSNGLALLRCVKSFVQAGRPPALVLSDQRMPAMTGLDVVAELRRHRWPVPVVIMTAFGDDDLAEQARRAGVTLLRKPFELEDLITLVGYILDRNTGSLVCAACGGTDDLRAADEAAHVFFCADCRGRYEGFDPSDPRVDVGAGD